MSRVCRACVALRVRWAWLRQVGQDRTWSLPDQEECSVGAFFATATVSTLGNRETTLFWTDNWIQGSSIRCLAPTVFTVVPRRRRSASVTEALNGRAWVHHTTGPPDHEITNRVPQSLDDCRASRANPGRARYVLLETQR